MPTIQGDLLKLAADGTFDVIVHGCNCHNTMGAGIAKSIKEKFPAAYEVDLLTEKGSREKLGTLTSAVVDCNGHSLTIVNAYTQYNWSGEGRNADYDAIRAAFREVKQQYAGARIGYPMIGAGLAGGDWSVISKVINEELNGEDHTLVEYKP
ncbi:MAG: macro domain-containing protein [Rubripirellula sp.]